MATEQSLDDAGSGSSDTSPIVAAVLSFFIPGVGHYLGGDSNRALIVFVAVFAYYFLSTILVFVGIGLLMLLAAPLVHIAAGADAFVQNN